MKIRQHFNRCIFGLACLIVSAWLQSSAYAEAYYVAKTGSDSRTCSQAKNVNTAKKTIAAGLQCLASGDTLTIKAGTYVESLDLMKVPNGTAGNYTTIRAETGETVWLKPTTPVANSVVAVRIKKRQYLKLERLRVDMANLKGKEYDGITVWYGHHILLDGVEVKNNTSPNGDGITVRDGATDVTIRNCYVHDLDDGLGAGSPNCGFYIQASTRTTVEGCLLERVDAAINLRSGTSGQNLVIKPIVRNNTIRNSNGGIIIQDETDDAFVYNNVVYNMSGTGIVVDGGEANFRMYNNTVYNTKKCGTNNGWASTAQQARVKNNIFYQGNCKGPIPPGNFTANPQFVNAANENFRLQATSQAINAGIKLAEVADDFDNIPRPVGAGYDFGAFEFHDGKQLGAPISLRIKSTDY